FDNDGRPDILLSGLLVDGVTPVTQVWRNSGNGTFSNLNATLPGVFGSSVAWADFDQTGKLGFFMMGQNPSGFISELFQNNTTNNATNTDSLLVAPSALKSTISSNGVVLSWKPHAPKTSASSISYNVRVGTYPGGSDVLVADADSATGLQQVAKPGNAQGRMFMMLTNLVPGTTYYWSVQAIDGAYAGSKFAHEVKFTVPPVAKN